MTDTRTPLIEFDAVSVSQGDLVILDQVSAIVPQQSWTSLIGPNGAGKTTLLKALLGQISYQGKIRFGSPEETPPPRIGYVPQRLDFDRGMPITVLEFLVMEQQRRPLWLGIEKTQREKAMEALRLVKAETLANRRLGALSGGEFQRALLALALKRDPVLLLLDEPSAGIDVRGEALFCEILDRLRLERGFTILMISHDLPEVTAHASHVICLNRHVIGQGAPAETLSDKILMETFGLHRGLPNVTAMHKGGQPCTDACCRKD